MPDCPKCKSDDVNFYADYTGRPARDHYCRCDNCGLKGPKSTTAEMALCAWDKMKLQIKRANAPNRGAKTINQAEKMCKPPPNYNGDDMCDMAYAEMDRMRKSLRWIIENQYAHPSNMVAVAKEGLGENA